MTSGSRSKSLYPYVHITPPTSKAKVLSAYTMKHIIDLEQGMSDVRRGCLGSLRLAWIESRQETSYGKPC